MLALKCFINNALFVNNAYAETSAIGELTTEAATFARDVGQYTSQTAKDLTLMSFSCKEEGVRTALPSALAEHVLAVAKFVYDKTINQAGEIFADVLLQELLVSFADKAENFEIGEIVTDGQYYAPEWMSWKAKNLAGVPDNELRVWFADESFRLQYDEYEIIVVPPTDNLDSFFRTGREVGDMLNSLTMPQMSQRMQNARAGLPETKFPIVTYDYVDQFDETYRVPSNWGLLIYGAAGNNVDLISDALVDYILANSTHPRSDWVKILPDLFKRTEFILIPSWYQPPAIPNRQTQTGVYSGVLNLTRALAKVREVVPGYPAAHIDEHTAAMPHPYGSLSILAVGGPDNRDGKSKITDIFPDYLSVPTSSQDYNRMTPATKAWLDVLQAQLINAEKLTEFSSVPQGMTRTKRNGIIYLVTNYNNINYLMAAKSNFV